MKIHLNKQQHQVKKVSIVPPSTPNQILSDRLDIIIQDNDLSPRECEIARLIAKGLPNKTIAAILEISPYTVSTHLRRMYAKKNVHCRSALVAILLA